MVAYTCNPSDGEAEIGQPEGLINQAAFSTLWNLGPNETLYLKTIAEKYLAPEEQYWASRICNAYKCACTTSYWIFLVRKEEI